MLIQEGRSSHCTSACGAGGVNNLKKKGLTHLPMTLLGRANFRSVQAAVSNTVSANSGYSSTQLSGVSAAQRCTSKKPEKKTIHSRLKLDETRRRHANSELKLWSYDEIRTSWWGNNRAYTTTFSWKASTKPSKRLSTTALSSREDGTSSMDKCGTCIARRT